MTMTPQNAMDDLDAILFPAFEKVICLRPSNIDREAALKSMARFVGEERIQRAWKEAVFEEEDA